MDPVKPDNVTKITKAKKEKKESPNKAEMFQTLADHINGQVT